MSPQVAVPGQASRTTRTRPGVASSLLLLLAAALLRCPAILIHGRMWGEELPVFLGMNWNHSFLFALEAQHFGYFSLWDNLLAAIAVHLVPLTAVALLFSWSGVVVLLLTGYLVYQAEFLHTPAAKLLGVLALVLTAPSVETWINLLNSEFFFGLWSAIILFSNAHRLRMTRVCALALAVVSGPLTTLLAPLFVLRALLERRSERFVQAAIVSAGGLFQLAVAHASAIAGRQVHPNPLAVVPVLFDKEIVELFLSRLAAKADLLLMRDHLHFDATATVLSWMGLTLGIAILGFVAKGQRLPALVIATAFWMASLEAMLGLNGGWALLATGERYSFLPNYLIQLALIVLAFSLAPGTRRTAARSLLAFSLCAGLVDFVLLPLRFKDAWNGEPWRAQVLRWEHDPSVQLHSFPTSWPGYQLPPRRER